MRFVLHPFGDIQLAKEIERERDNERGGGGEGRHADAREDADCGRRPNERCGRDAMRAVVRFDDESCAEKSDTHHNICDHREKAAVSRDDVSKIPGVRGNQIGEHEADHCEDRGAARNEHLGSDPRFFFDDLALHAKDRAEHERDDEPRKHLFKRQHYINISISAVALCRFASRGRRRAVLGARLSLGTLRASEAPLKAKRQKRPTICQI